MNRRLSLAFAIVLTFVLGCGGNKAPVRGQLVYPDGRPVTEMENGQVIFEPEDLQTQGNYSAAGFIDKEGKFELTTDKSRDGGILGKNKVLIVRYIPDPERPPPRILHERYEKFDTSGIVLEVVPGQNDFKITVEPLPKKR